MIKLIKSITIALLIMFGMFSISFGLAIFISVCQLFLDIFLLLLVFFTVIVYIFILSINKNN